MRSVIIEFHKPELPWFSYQADLFNVGIGCGLFTILILRERWTRLASDLTAQLKRLRGELQ